MADREYLRHELLDRLAVVVDMIDVVLKDHWALSDDSGAFGPFATQYIKASIDEASTALMQAYRAVADIHLNSKEKNV